tara:strand:- start:6193 stop:6585 length:393 start_codon:yes stop_codon:yes gene_type:complete
MGNNHKFDKPEKFCLYCSKSLALKRQYKQVKYCCDRCRVMARRESGYFQKKYKMINKPHLKKCKVCERKISKVGERKGCSKYCSDTCMYIATKHRDRNQKHIYIKVKISDYPEVVRTIDALKRVGLFVES